MNPFNRMTLQFHQDFDYFLRTPELALLRVCLSPSFRPALVKLLRTYEAHPHNARPYFIVEVPFNSLETNGQSVLGQLRDDYAALQKGLAEEGTVLPPLSVLPDCPHALELTLAFIARALSERFPGALLVLLPKELMDGPGLSAHVERLVRILPPFFKLVAMDTPEMHLLPLEKQLPGRVHAADFSMDDASIQAFVAKEAKVAVAKAADAAKQSGRPMSSPWTPELIAALQGHLMDAAQHLGAARWAQAVSHQEVALQLCLSNGLRLEAVTVRLALGNSFLGWQKPESALEHYRNAVELAAGAGNPALLCQARLGLAGALFRLERYGEAAAAYEQTASDAGEAGVEVLRLEALRMAGTCHHLRRRAREMLRLWQQAIDIGAILPPDLRAQSTFRQVGEALASRSRALGLHAQARSVEQLVQELQSG